MNEIRKANILAKYGTLEEYERRRAQKTRETALRKCSTEEQKTTKLRDFEFRDFIKQNYDASKIDRPCICIDCGAEFVGNTRQQILCRSCFLKRRKIARFGSPELAKAHMREQQKKTLRERYGDEHFNNRELSEKTCLKKYGYTHQAKNSAVVDKINTTKEKRYGRRGYNNREKCAATLSARYGEEIVSTAQLPEVRSAQRKTKLDRYGDENFNNRSQNAVTCQERYGGNSPLASEEVQRKGRETMTERYGAEYPMQVEELRQQVSKTNIEKYGVENPMQNEDIKSRSIQTKLDRYGCLFIENAYEYKNICFDSSWELAYYIYLEDHNIPFEYKPKRTKYIKNKRVCSYYPDFLVNGEYVEIKGDHLIDEDGVLVNYNNEKLVEKTMHLQELGAKILTSRELQDVFEYIKAQYSDSYLKQFKRKHNDKSQ